MVTDLTSAATPSAYFTVNLLVHSYDYCYQLVIIMIETGQFLLILLLEEVGSAEHSHLWKRTGLLHSPLQVRAGCLTAEILPQSSGIQLGLSKWRPRVFP